VHCKIQSCPIVREGALHEEANKYLIKGSLQSDEGHQKWPDTKTNWPTDRRLQMQLQLPPSAIEAPYFVVFLRLLPVEAPSSGTFHSRIGFFSKPYPCAALL
jgi:hypothetical protein